jgi:hypothetical protein
MDWFDVVWSVFFPRRGLGLALDPLDNPDYGFTEFVKLGFAVLAVIVGVLTWLGVPVLADHPVVVGTITFIVLLLVWTVAPGYTALKAYRSIQETGDRWERRHPQLYQRKRRS